MKCLWCERQTKKDTTRIPQGWHRDRAGNPICSKCWGERYILRAAALPIAWPVNGPWKELQESLREAWAASTACTNWAMSELFAADVTREPGMEKIPPMPPVYLYPEARAKFPTLASQSTGALLQAANKKYRKRRYKTVWTCEESLPNYRYPTPYPMHNNGWKASRDKDGNPIVSVRIGDRRWTLRLRGGREFRRQLVRFDQIVAEIAHKGELAIYRVDGSGHHRGGVKGRDSGGQHKQFRVMVKLVAWFPRPPKQERHGTLFVRTDTDALVVAMNAKDERVWIYHADHIRRWVREHDRRLQRWSDDTKAENRPPKFQSLREASVRKFRDRTDSAIHEISASLVNYANRRRFAAIRYDDSDQSYVGHFPYFVLCERIAQKADAAGIAFERFDGEENTETARVTAKEV